MYNLRYSIEKISENADYSTYKMTYALEGEGDVLVQKENAILHKEDADGTKTKEAVPLQVASIASYTNSNIQTATKDKYNGFAVNVSDKNLAIGGTYYSIESTVGTYANDSSDYYPYVSPWEELG